MRYGVLKDHKMKIRPTKSTDIPALQLVLDGTELFPREMLPDMLAAFLSDEKSEDVWLTCENEGEAIGFCYAAPEALTEGTWNMLAIAVIPEKQHIGVGSAMIKHLEDALRADGHRVLIADTSSTEEFSNTRSFYRNNGYTEEARIRNFWAEGDDKITFWKSLK